MIYLILRLVHVLFMATWIGAVFFTSGDVQRSLEAGPEHLPLLQERIGRNLRVASPSAILTILSGFGLIFSLGGMGSVPPAIHTGMTLGLLAWAVSAVGIGGSWRKIQTGLADGHDRAALAPLLKRMKISTMAFQTLWLVCLILMIFRHGLG